MRCWRSGSFQSLLQADVLLPATPLEQFADVLEPDTHDRDKVTQFILRAAQFREPVGDLPRYAEVDACRIVRFRCRSIVGHTAPSRRQPIMVAGEVADDRRNT